MAPSLAVPSFATVASLVLVCGACASTPSDPAPRCPIDHPGHVRLDLPGRGLTDVPLDAIAMPAGVRYGVADLCPVATARIQLEGTYHGASGAPVYAHGELVGGVSKTMEYEGRDLGLGFWSIDEIRRWSRIADEAVSESAGWPNLDESHASIRSGSSVVLATVWGDLEVESNATVTERVGDRITIRGHSSDPNATGTRRALVRVSNPLAISASIGAFGRVDFKKLRCVTESLEPVGAVAFDGPRGAVAVLGKEPPHFRFTIELCSDDTVLVRHESFVVHMDWEHYPARDIALALAPVVPDGSSCQAWRSDESVEPYDWSGRPAEELIRDSSLYETISVSLEAARIGDDILLRIECPRDGDEGAAR